MPEQSEDVDPSDLLYSRYPLPVSEAAHFWLRTAWDLIEDGKQIPSEVSVELERWGIDVPEYVAWVEVMIETFEDRPVIYRKTH